MDAILFKLVYGVFAESVWLCIGASVGIGGLFIAASLRKDNGGRALSFLVLVTAPTCAILSAGVAVFYLGSSVEDRVVTCGAFNGVMLVLVSTYTQTFTTLTHTHTKTHTHTHTHTHTQTHV
jgi:hypothetical protein